MSSFFFLPKVDDNNISSMKHMDAVNVLRATKQHVKLVVLRRPTGVSSKVQGCCSISCFPCRYFYEMCCAPLFKWLLS